MSGQLLLPDHLDHWQHRAVRETGGNQTMLGCFVLAILGWQSGRKPPRFGKIARVDKDGQLWSNLQTADGQVLMNHHLGPVKQVIDEFRGLADHMKLADEERVQMFSELRKWIAIDERANDHNGERVPLK